MTRFGRSAAALALLAGVIALTGVREARAHQDPVGCSGTGLTLNIFVFFADGISSPGAGGVVSECETLIYKGSLGFPGGGVCSFEGGTLTITTPDGAPHNVTPIGGVPKLGGTGGVSSVDSQTATYMVRTQDIVAGQISSAISYSGATAHTGPGTSDAHGVPNGSTSVPNTVELCPTDTDCVDNFCNPVKTDGVRTGLCDSTNKADSTPCPDTDANACTTAGCNGQGTCDQNHVVNVCQPDTNECTNDLPCNTQTGACLHPPKADSTPCTDTDNNACTTAGCNGAGTCDQNHQTTVCPADTNECTDDLPCNTLTGACEHPNKADSTPCTDTDGQTCTTAGCDGAGNCDQLHIQNCVQEICRTPGFWGTHGGTEKDGSQNITQAVLDAGGPLTICGRTIDSTTCGDNSSALEAICVSPQGNQKLQLARQLTAAALNCIITSGNADCTGVSIHDTFVDCNNACVGGSAQQVTDCISAIDCFNNGGTSTGGICATGTCSDNGQPCNGADLTKCATPGTATCTPDANSCHNQPLCNEGQNLCFEPPGPAGSPDTCHSARKSGCNIFSLSCSACQ